MWQKKSLCLNNKAYVVILWVQHRLIVVLLIEFDLVQEDFM
jgi:hypothetical protein